MKRANVWVYLAVNKPGLKSGDPRLWRCFIDDASDAIPIHGCCINGDASPENWKTDGQQKPNDRDLIGWVQMYGDIVIVNDYLTIQLKHPT